MSMSPTDLARLSASVALFKGQALGSIFGAVPGSGSSSALPGLLGGAQYLKRQDTFMFTPGGLFTPNGAQAEPPRFGSLLDQFSAALHMTELPTSTTPGALDAAGSFSRPGQNMVTVLNRVEITFKAQHSELGALKASLGGERQAASRLNALTATSSNADITAALDGFVASYNAGVKRFAPELAKGGILEGSWEATRARFATERDINYILNGAELGLKGGLAVLGISTDPKTALATVDHVQLGAALEREKASSVKALTSFATTFAATVDSLGAANHSHVRQMNNLDRAVHWIHDNKAAVQKEFGAGAAATPNEAFARAAAQYDTIAHLHEST